LTKDNVTAPWVNFEAGAAHMAIKDKPQYTKGKPLTALLIDLSPTDFSGPLTRFQNTRITRDDMLKLVNSINECHPIETKSEKEVLQKTFDLAWGPFDDALKAAIERTEIKGGASTKSEEFTAGDLKPILDEILLSIRSEDRVKGYGSSKTEVILISDDIIGELSKVMGHYLRYASMLINDKLALSGTQSEIVSKELTVAVDFIKKSMRTFLVHGISTVGKGVG
jgi:hypothetical protein